MEVIVKNDLNRLKAADPIACNSVVATPPNVAKIKHLGGSASDTFNGVLINQVFSATWVVNSGPDANSNMMTFVAKALAGIKTTDELEGLLAGQIAACHNVAMECFRRASLSEQTFEARHENLSQANKLSRTMTTLLEG